MSRVTASAFFLLCLFSPLSSVADVSSDINAALDYYAQVWDEGDLAALRGYYHPEFVLIANGNKLSLSQRMEDLEVVMKTGEDHGELNWSDLTIESLGKDHALAYGHLKLAFKDGTELDTWFSTVYVKTPFGWKALMTHN